MNRQQAKELLPIIQAFGWVKSYHGQFVITAIRDNKATIGRNDNFLNYDYILESYTFADGTPFCIIEN